MGQEAREVVEHRLVDISIQNSVAQDPQQPAPRWLYFEQGIGSDDLQRSPLTLVIL